MTVAIANGRLINCLQHRIALSLFIRDISSTYGNRHYATLPPNGAGNSLVFRSNIKLKSAKF